MAAPKGPKGPEGPEGLEAPEGPEALETLEPGDPSSSPVTGWAPWLAPLGLVLGVLLALVGGLLVDVPALAFGVHLSSSHTPPGLTIADTFVQDVCFILAAVYCARLGGRKVRSWQFGLRRPGVGWRSAAAMIVLLMLAFVILSVAWSEAFTPEKEQLLKQLGTNEGTALLLLSAALTCVVAPIGEEFLFRGLMFTSLREWRGTLPAAIIDGLLFGAVHIGSAPALDLIPLAALGFGLCLLYRYTGSLYPGVVTHSLNNCVAFAGLEGWGVLWQPLALIAGSLAAIWLIVRSCKRVGLIAPEGVESAASWPHQSLGSLP